VAFTLAYFVVVEAMCKTFGILHGDRAALAMAPFVWGLGQAMALPTRLLIGLANLLLPGKGLPQGPFVIEQEIRSMAELGHAAGVIEEHEKELIHSVFEFGDTVVREVMVPRPDIVAAETHMSLGDVQELMLRHGFSRLPVYRDGLDRIEGIVFAKDMLSTLHQGRRDVPLTEILRPARFVPESKRVAELLREMQRERFHMALVTDEYGSLSSLVTLEDLLEELVGEIADEYDRSEAQMQPVGEGCYRVSGAPIRTMAAWGQGSRGAAGYEDAGSSELVHTEPSTPRPRRRKVRVRTPSGEERKAASEKRLLPR
jgi:CBS domain containing-hemolysin-like protein